MITVLIIGFCLMAMVAAFSIGYGVSLANRLDAMSKKPKIKTFNASDVCKDEEWMPF